MESLAKGFYFSFRRQERPRRITARSEPVRYRNKNLDASQAASGEPPVVPGKQVWFEDSAVKRSWNECGIVGSLFFTIAYGLCRILLTPRQPHSTREAETSPIRTIFLGGGFCVM